LQFPTGQQFYYHTTHYHHHTVPSSGSAHLHSSCTPSLGYTLPATVVHWTPHCHLPGSGCLGYTLRGYTRSFPHAAVLAHLLPATARLLLQLVGLCTWVFFAVRFTLPSPGFTGSGILVACWITLLPQFIHTYSSWVLVPVTRFGYRTQFNPDYATVPTHTHCLRFYRSSGCYGYLDSPAFVAGRVWCRTFWLPFHRCLRIMDFWIYYHWFGSAACTPRTVCVCSLRCCHAVHVLRLRTVAFGLVYLLGFLPRIGCAAWITAFCHWIAFSFRSRFPGLPAFVYTHAFMGLPAHLPTFWISYMRTRSGLHPFARSAARFCTTHVRSDFARYFRTFWISVAVPVAARCRVLRWIFWITCVPTAACSYLPRIPPRSATFCRSAPFCVCVAWFLPYGCLRFCLVLPCSAHWFAPFGLRLRLYLYSYLDSAAHTVARFTGSWFTPCHSLPRSACRLPCHWFCRALRAAVLVAPHTHRLPTPPPSPAPACVTLRAISATTTAVAHRRTTPPSLATPAPRLPPTPSARYPHRTPPLLAPVACLAYTTTDITLTYLPTLRAFWTCVLHLPRQLPAGTPLTYASMPVRLPAFARA